MRKADPSVITLIVENLKIHSPGAVIPEQDDEFSLKVNKITRTSYEFSINLMN